MREDQDGWNVYVSAAKSGAEPNEPVRVNHVPGNASPHDEAPAQVAVGPEGNVYVLWTNRIDVEGRRFPASNLLFSVSQDDGACFSQERVINSDADEPPSSHTFHDMIVLDDGTIVVSWIDSRARDRQMRAEGLRVPASVEDHRAMHGAGMDRRSHEMAGPQIWVARSTDGGKSFTETAIVDQNSCPCCRTTLAAGLDGSVYLGWRHVFENGDRDVVVARSDDGGMTFSAPVRVAVDGWNIDACPHAGPALAVDAAGRLHVAWYTGAPDAPGLYRSVSEDRGERFTSRIPVATGVAMAHADLARGIDDRIEMAYHLPEGQQLVRATLDTKTVTASRAAVGGRPSMASADRSVALVSIADDTIKGEVLRF